MRELAGTNLIENPAYGGKGAVDILLCRPPVRNRDPEHGLSVPG